MVGFRRSRFILQHLLLLTFLLTGCASGNQYHYAEADIELSFVGDGSLGLAVIDARQYVLEGIKSANFVGLQRGRYANPFDVTTSTGNPLAIDMQTLLSAELSESGFEVIDLQIHSGFSEPDTSAVSASGARRSLVLIVKEWKTDALVNLGLHYHLILLVYNESGALLAQEDTMGHEKLDWARRESRNSDTAIEAFEYRVKLLLKNPIIKAALD